MSLSTAHESTTTASRRRSARAVLPLVAASMLGATALAVSPTAAADDQHTVTFQITGAGDAFSIIPDPGTPVYPPSDTTWVKLPWTQSAQASTGQLVALNWTDKTGSHDCVISVDGKPVPLTEHSPGRCAAVVPAGAPAPSVNGSPFLEELRINNVVLPGKSPAETLAAGQAACADLRSGTSVLDEMSAVEKKYGFNQGTLFVSAATTHLCPNFASGG
ncbi:MAG: hypothetical protein QOH60_4442 [Mycobacterium sp.]|jgi:hypothetical protein|nr:hypothetical protein [Mycobacterium sp.]